MNYLSTHSPFTPAEKAAKQSLFKDFGCLFFRFISGNNSIYFSFDADVSFGYDIYFFKDDHFLSHDFSFKGRDDLHSIYNFNFSWDKSLFQSTYTGSNFSYLISKFYYSNYPISYGSSSVMSTLLFQYLIKYFLS